MREANDLPLFRWTPPTARVIAFPTERRIGKIRRVVDVLSGRSGKGAEVYWTKTVSDMTRQMTAAGIDAAEIDREIQAFTESVQRALYGHTLHDLRPDGDAA
ncbi:DUF6074 family protein [Kaistia terrae]|uniref:DUF6074 family protein n=1 Tax=Kaistia terrae TaxID=537017 RepID=A0ABW0PWQ4_9HYPH|nr:DUF6074 family protein [Kaistia terrae]MCX5580527.1 DUF6074 family protein [Kaistia terrae]